MNSLPQGKPELRPFKMFARILYFTLFATVGLYWFFVVVVRAHAVRDVSLASLS